MNLTFFDQAYWWDVIFTLVLVVCVTVSYRRGAFRALSGIAGTVGGVILGNLYQDDLAPHLEPLLRPVMQWMAQKADLSHVTGLQEGSVLSDLVAQSSVLTDKMSELYHGLMEALAQALTASLAPIVAFLLIFAVTKLFLQLLCALLDWDIPIISGLNRMAGGLLGAVAGCVTVVALCWAVMRFAPAENLGLLSQPCLLESFTGGFLAPLFPPTI